MATNRLSGPGYLLAGLQLLTHRELRGFVVVPLLINLLLFIGLTLLVVDQFSLLIDGLMGYLPEWLDFLAWIAWVLFAGLLLMVYGYSFALVGNLLASPFYGLLAEKVSALENPSREHEALSFKSALAIAGRSVKREGQKLWYFLPRIAGVLLVALALSFIPLLNLLSPVMIFLWSAWSLALQYLDYGADNNNVAFTTLRREAGGRKFAAISFGGSALLATTIPVFNLIAIPASVIGGTLMWERSVKEHLTKERFIKERFIKK